MVDHINRIYEKQNNDRDARCMFEDVYTLTINKYFKIKLHNQLFDYESYKK